MGVSLTELASRKEIGLEDLAGNKIAVDAYNIIYQFLASIRDRFTGEPLRDSQGRITSHLSGFFYRTVKLLENQIMPIYVFDGEPPKFKKKTTEARATIRREAEIKWKEAVERKDFEAVRRFSQQASRVTGDMIEESKRLLGFMGISWVQAPSEGEAQASYMVSKGSVYAVGSQDWDSLLFGAERLVRNLAITGRRKLPRKEKYIEIRPELVELKSVLRELDIDRDQLIMLGILIGTDYNPGGVRKVGPKTALKLVKEYKSMERVFGHVDWDFDIRPAEIFEFFKKPPVEERPIEKQRFQPEKLRYLLVEGHSFDAERIDSMIKKMQDSVESGKQSSLGRFLG